MTSSVLSVDPLSGRRTIICAIVGQLSSCAPIHRRSVSALVSSKRPVETGQQDKSCPTIAQIIVPRPLRSDVGCWPLTPLFVAGMDRDIAPDENFPRGGH